MIKEFIKRYTSNFITVSFGMLALCLIQFSNVFANIKQTENNISQQKIVVTFKPGISQSDSDATIKDNINNENLKTPEHLKVKVQTPSQIHNFLKNNNIKVTANNIGTGYVITNFKSNEDFKNYAQEMKKQNGVALVETNKTNSVINNSQHNIFIYGISLIIILMALSFTLLYQKEQKTQELTLMILNGKNDKDLIAVNTLIIALMSLFISGITLLLTGIIISNVIQGINTQMIFQSNFKLLITALIITVYNTVFYFFNTKITFKKKTTW